MAKPLSLKYYSGSLLLEKYTKESPQHTQLTKQPKKVSQRSVRAIFQGKIVIEIFRWITTKKHHTVRAISRRLFIIEILLHTLG